jgi:hypothetical protein
MTYQQLNNIGRMIKSDLIWLRKLFPKITTLENYCRWKALSSEYLDFLYTKEFYTYDLIESSISFRTLEKK